jgi:hypothetical protein
MEVTIRVSRGALSEIVGRSDVIIKCENPVRVIDVLNILAEKFGKPFRDYVFDAKTGEVKKYLILALNGVSISSMKGIETQIDDRSELLMLTATGGG